MTDKKSEIIERLKALRAQTPEPEAIVIEHEPTQTPCEVPVKIKNALATLYGQTPAPEPVPPPNVAPGLMPATKPGEPCPWCGKVLSRPSRHKCPVVGEKASFAGTDQKEPEPERNVEAISVDQFAAEHGIRRPAKSVVDRVLDKIDKAEIREGLVFEDEPPGVPVFDLYIDCAVVKNEDLYTDVIFLHDWILDCAERVCAAENAPHWKCVGYGKGPGLLAVACEEKIKAAREIGVLFASSSSMEFRAVESVLRRYAKNIVIGGI